MRDHERAGNATMRRTHESLNFMKSIAPFASV
jgi:hypothetical protein